MQDRLIRTGDEGVTLTPSVLRTLIGSGNGDAALLYLALLRRGSGANPRSLAGELRWSRERIEAAEQALLELKLLSPAEPEPPAAEERPAYGSGDVAEKLESSAEFRSLVGQVEQRMGKKLTTVDVGALLGLYDYLGLPGNVIYQLVSHCMERTERRLGPGRRPGLREIEKTGYAWARMGIDHQEAVDAYLRRYSERQGALPAYMRVLNLPERLPSASEEKYLSAWQEMGFPPESVALAYDKTVLRCGEFRWPYCNGILKKWHAAGLHAPAEIGSESRPAKAEPAGKTAGRPRTYISEEDNSWGRKYIRHPRKEE